MTKTFEERVAKLGFSNPKLWPGEEIEALITVNSIEHLKDILDFGGDKAAREAHLKALFDGVTQRSDDESALLHRVYQYVFGSAGLSDEDRKLIDPAFPLVVKAFAAQDKTINSQWNLGKSTSPVIVTLGTLTIEQGGFITIENTALDFIVENLVRNGNTGNTFGDFNILGVNGSTGRPGDQPSPPGQAQSGSGGSCPGTGGGNGWRGADGTKGGFGDKGGNGLPSLLATIRITNGVKLGPNVSQIVVMTTSGAGGAGGPGGTGARGGKGGNGGNGVTCVCSGTSGGTGGQGGNGGPGGQGGPGGNAVDAAGNVTIWVPSQDTTKFRPIALDAQPGKGGARGAGGPPGEGGGGSTGGKNCAGGGGGDVGGPGQQGELGPDGTQTGKPATIIVQPI